jgi:predicted nucleotidyltransferase
MKPRVSPPECRICPLMPPGIGLSIGRGAGGIKDMRIDDILKKRRTEILGIAARHGGKNIRLFGSTARGIATESSDVDILLELEGGRSLLDLVAIKQELEDLLGREVHVVTEPSLSPYLREEIVKEAVSI